MCTIRSLLRPLPLMPPTCTLTVSVHHRPVMLFVLLLQPFQLPAFLIHASHDACATSRASQDCLSRGVLPSLSCALINLCAPCMTRRYFMMIVPSSCWVIPFLHPTLYPSIHHKSLSVLNHLTLLRPYAPLPRHHGHGFVWPLRCADSPGNTRPLLRSTFYHASLNHPIAKWPPEPPPPSGRGVGCLLANLPTLKPYTVDQRCLVLWSGGSAATLCNMSGVLQTSCWTQRLQTSHSVTNKYTVSFCRCCPTGPQTPLGAHGHCAGLLSLPM